MAEQLITEKQRLAIEAFINGASKTEACRIAGYKDDTEAVRLFGSKTVSREIEKIRALARKELSIEVKHVLEGFMDAVAAATNAMELVAAWREIGKVIGAYEHAKKIEVDVRTQVEHIQSTKQLERMSDGDLAVLADLGDDFIIADYTEVEAEAGAGVEAEDEFPEEQTD